MAQPLYSKTSVTAPTTSGGDTGWLDVTTGGRPLRHLKVTANTVGPHSLQVNDDASVTWAGASFELDLRHLRESEPCIYKVKLISGTNDTTFTLAGTV